MDKFPITRKGYEKLEREISLKVIQKHHKWENLCWLHKGEINKGL